MPRTSLETPWGQCLHHLFVCFGLMSPDLACSRFSGVFVGGVDGADNSVLSRLLGASCKSLLPVNYLLDRPALKHPNTNQNTRIGHFTTTSKRPEWLNCISNEGISRLKAWSVSTQKSQEIGKKIALQTMGGGAPPAHCLFCQRSVGQDSKRALCHFLCFWDGNNNIFSSA